MKVAHEDIGDQAGFFKVQKYESMYVCNNKNISIARGIINEYIY